MTPIAPTAWPRPLAGQPVVWACGLLSLGAALVILSAAVGSTGLEALWWWSYDTKAASVAQQIVWDIRLPRGLGAWAAGALLGLAGAVAQGLFRNPLADPFMLGSASGASLGVAIALASFAGAQTANVWLVQLGLSGAGFVGALIGVLLTLVLASGVQHTLRLLLAGVIVGVVLGAVKDLIVLASPQVLQAMQAFMQGSTAFIGWSSFGLIGSVWLVCLCAAVPLGRVLDGLSLGESTARSLGLPLAPLRVALVLIFALACGTAVAQTGLIAFVGLAAPHLVRSVVKTTHGWLIFLSSLMGANLLCIADLLARWLIAPQELPVGILTALLGGSYLLWLMYRRAGVAGGSTH